MINNLSNNLCCNLQKFNITKLLYVVQTDMLVLFTVGFFLDSKINLYYIYHLYKMYIVFIYLRDVIPRE